MPRLAKRADKYTIIRSVTTMNRPGDHAAPRCTGSPATRACPAAPPSIRCTAASSPKLRPGPADLPTFAALGKIDHHINNAIAPASSARRTTRSSSIRSSARTTSPRCSRRRSSCPRSRDADLLRAVDKRLRRQDALDPLIAGLDQYQQTAFNLLRSPRLREALDLSKEPQQVIDRYAAGEPARPATPRATRSTSCSPAG